MPAGMLAVNSSEGRGRESGRGVSVEKGRMGGAGDLYTFGGLAGLA